MGGPSGTHGRRLLFCSPCSRFVCWLSPPQTQSRVFANVPALLFGVYRGTRVTPASRKRTQFPNDQRNQLPPPAHLRPGRVVARSKNPQRAHPLTPWVNGLLSAALLCHSHQSNGLRKQSHHRVFARVRCFANAEEISAPLTLFYPFV